VSTAVTACASSGSGDAPAHTVLCPEKIVVRSTFPRPPRRATLPAMQTNGKRLEQADATVRMTVQEAAAALGVTVEAVRGRMHRGKYGREQGPGGRVFVLVPADLLPDHEPERSTERLGERSANVESNVGSGPAEVVERLLDEVAFLRAELAERSDALRRREVLHGEEIRRRDHIIAGLVERLPPQLEAPASPAPREAHQTVAEEPDIEEHRPATDGPQEGAERRSSWWRQFFGF
jgi:hypothetical protein